MAYTYHVDFSHKHLTGVRNMTLKKNASAKKNVKATRKCYEFSSAAADVHKSRDSPEIVPVGQVKSLTAPWLYGPACSLATKGVIYPCSRYRCCIPCPCGLCKKVPRTCQASESCYCEECRGKFQDHKNFHQAFHQLCEFCCQLVKCFPALNLSYWGAMDVEDSDAFASLAIEAVKGEKVYTHSELPGVKMTLKESGEWYSIFENRRRGLADKPWRCWFCDAIFKSLDQQTHLREHIITKHSGGPAFMDHKYLVNYIKDASTTQLACELCSKNFSSRHDLERHIGALHHGESFMCDKCSKIFKREDNYRNHLKTHYDSENTCLTCGKNFWTAAALSKHLEKGTCGLQCEKCAKTFSRRSSMLNHLKKCQANKEKTSEQSCGLCGTAFETKVLLERHRKDSSNTDGSSKFSCLQCQMIFCSLDLRRAHDKEGCVKKCDLDEWMRRLREEKMFQCEKCGLIFSSETGFKKHFWNHIDKKKVFDCKHCEVTFQWMKALKRHTDERFDSEGNPKNVCDVCGLEFCTGKQKKAHYIANHRDFTCSVCGQSFSMKKHLKEHERKQIKLSCKDCDKIFCSKWVLKEHLESVHKNFLEAKRIYKD